MHQSVNRFTKFSANKGLSPGITGDTTGKSGMSDGAMHRHYLACHFAFILMILTSVYMCKS
jgi:hypothetical protein